MQRKMIAAGKGATIMQRHHVRRGFFLSAAIAACLARGMPLADSVGAAKRFVTDAILRAPRLGRGHGPINHSIAARL